MATAKLKRKPRLSKIESLKAKEARLNLVSAQKLASSYNIYIALLCSSLVARRSSASKRFQSGEGPCVCCGCGCGAAATRRGYGGSRLPLLLLPLPPVEPVASCPSHITHKPSSSLNLSPVLLFS
jgi:hypothetical protein